MDISNKCTQIREFLTSFVASPVSLEIGDTSNCSNERKIENSSDGRLPRGRIQPSSKTDFLIRLSSFKFGCWMTIGISPLLCARYGWVLRDNEVLQCVTCQALISTTLPPVNQHDAYTTFVEILKDRLKTGHKDWCCWCDSPSPEEFTHPPLGFSLHFLENLKNDVRTLSSLGPRLPYINIKECLLKLNLEEWHMTILYGNQNTLDDEQLAAAILVLTGWCLGKNHHLKCSICARRIGLWNFLPFIKKNEFLSLQERVNEKQKQKAIYMAAKKAKEEEKRLKEEARRRKLEEKQRIREEKERKTKEAEAEELARIAREEESIKAIESMTYEQLLDERVGDSEEEVEEEEESILLGEKEAVSGLTKNESATKNEDVPYSSLRESTSNDKDTSPDTTGENKFNAVNTSSDSTGESPCTVKDLSPDSTKESTTGIKNASHDSASESKTCMKGISLDSTSKMATVLDSPREMSYGATDGEQPLNTVDDEKVRKQSVLEETGNQEPVLSLQGKDVNNHGIIENRNETTESCSEKMIDKDDLLTHGNEENIDISIDSEKGCIHNQLLPNEREIDAFSNNKNCSSKGELLQSFTEERGSTDKDVSEKILEKDHEMSENIEKAKLEADKEKDVEREIRKEDKLRIDEEELAGRNNYATDGESQIQDESEHTETLRNTCQTIHGSCEVAADKENQTECGKEERSDLADNQSSETSNSNDASEELNNDDDDLWLEAIGGEKKENPQSVSSDEGYDDTAKEEYLPINNCPCSPSLVSQRKRSRSIDSQSDSGEEQASKRLALEQFEANKENISHLKLSWEQADREGLKQDCVTCSSTSSSHSSSSCEDNREEEDAEDTDDQLFKQLTGSLFDPFGEHRPWCGWVAKCSMNCFEMETDEQRHMPGYLILPPQIKALLPQSPVVNLLSSKIYRENMEGLREIRSALYDWELQRETWEEEMDTL